MTTTADRLRLYEHARESWDEPTARILMELLPQDASELATHGDLRVLSAELRGEMADLRAELRVELSDRFAEQTRTLVLAMLSIVLTVVTFSVGAVLLA